MHFPSEFYKKKKKKRKRKKEPWGTLTLVLLKKQTNKQQKVRVYVCVCVSTGSRPSVCYEPPSERFSLGSSCFCPERISVPNVFNFYSPGSEEEETPCPCDALCNISVVIVIRLFFRPRRRSFCTLNLSYKDLQTCRVSDWLPLGGCVLNPCTLSL